MSHGTCSHRSRTDGELFSRLGRAALGKEYRDFLVLDGPGGRSTDPAHPMAGTFDPYTRAKTLKTDLGHRNPELGFTYAHPVKGWSGDGAAARPVFHTTLALRESPLGRLLDAVLDRHVPSAATGALTGAGWDDNVRHAVAAIAELDGAGELPDVVNIAGWSRGAVTGLRVANALHAIFPSVEVNLFAVDPVVGGPAGLELPDVRTIPPNVRKIVVTLAADELYFGFAPQDAGRLDVVDPSRTRVVFLPFPGDHCAQVLAPNPSMVEATSIVGGLVHRFLTAHGSRLGSGFDMPARFLLEHYASLADKRHAYRRDGRDLVARTLPRPRGLAYAPGVFVNEHHWLLLRSELPNLHRCLVAEGRSPILSELAREELRVVRATMPATHRLLRDAGLVDDGTRLEPSGVVESAAQLARLGSRAEAMHGFGLA